MKVKVCILSVFLSVLLLFSVNVKASNVQLPTLPDDENNYYVIVYDNWDDNAFELYTFSNNEVKINDYEYFGMDSVLIFSSDYNLYRLEDGMWKYRNSYGPETTMIMNSSGIRYSTCDIVHEVTGQVVFMKALIKVNLSHQMGKIQMRATMKTVVYLIPLLIPLLVSFLAFRKALAWLLKVLRKA